VGLHLFCHFLNAVNLPFSGLDVAIVSVLHGKLHLDSGLVHGCKGFDLLLRLSADEESYLLVLFVKEIRLEVIRVIKAVHFSEGGLSKSDQEPG